MNNVKDSRDIENRLNSGPLKWAVVVAQLAEWSLPTSEPIPVYGIFLK